MMTRGTVLAAVVVGLVLAVPARADTVEVAVEGVSGNLRDNVIARLSIVRYRTLPDLTETMVRRLHTRVPAEVREALQPFGYYEPDIRASLEGEGGRWRARYVIVPGEPVRIRSVELVVNGPGRADPSFAPPDELPRVGSRLRHADYEAIKQRFMLAASNRGYLDARFTTSELRVSARERAADIVLHFETGERYQFGAITLQQDVLDEDLTQRYIQFKEGDPFSVASLLTLQYSLSDSEYFSVVEVDARREDAVDYAVPVIIRTQPRARHRYTLGLGYATDTGPRVTAGIENRRVNPSGHRMLSELELSQVRRSLNTRYQIPLENPVWDRLTLGAGLVREDLGDVRSDRAELSVARSTRAGRWQQTLSTRLQRERDEVAGQVSLRTQLIPGGEWIYMAGDTGLNPRKGYRVNLSLSGSDPALGAPTPFVLGRTRVRWFVPIGERDRLLLRGELGATLAGDASLLTATQRFFAGGDNSVRGYRYNALGPVDADGNVVGGRYLATFSAEWEHWLTERWGFGLFADAGNAFNGRGEGLFKGAGVGLRWQLPFAVIALDVAHPFDDPGGRSVRVHLNLGADL